MKAVIFNKNIITKFKQTESPIKKIQIIYYFNYANYANFKNLKTQ